MSDLPPSSRTRSTHGEPWPFIPGVECYSAWKEALSSLVDCSIPAGTSPETFDFHGISWQLPEAYLQIHGGSAMNMARTPAIIAQRPKFQITLYMLTAGSVSGNYDGIELTHLPGDIVAIDYSHPYATETLGFEGIAISFDKSRAPFGLQGQIHGMVVRADSAAGVYLGNQLRGLIDVIERLNVAQAQAAVEGILRFAEDALSFDGADTMRDDAAIFAEASRLALRHIANPDFGPDTLAVTLNISRSKLFRAFKDHGGVQRWLLGERLTASLLAIIRSTGNTKIATIAHQHGFRSEAHFSRAFQKRYQISPSAARDLASAGTGSTLYLDWLSTNGREHQSIVETWLNAAQTQQ